MSSEPGARGATAEAESENTSTSSPPPEEGGGPVGAGGAAPRPSRSADGEGVDWKIRKGNISMDPWILKTHTALYPLPGQVTRRLGKGAGSGPETTDQQERAADHIQSKATREFR